MKRTTNWMAIQNDDGGWEVKALFDNHWYVAAEAYAIPEYGTTKNTAERIAKALNLADIPLQKKIDNLHPWFRSLIDAGYTIHDVIEYNEETWVIWSDSKGYSVSNIAYDGKSRVVSGTYPDLRGCINYIYFSD